MKYLVNDPTKKFIIVDSEEEALKLASAGIKFFEEEALLDGKWDYSVEFIGIYQIEEDQILENLDEIELVDLKMLYDTVGSGDETSLVYYLKRIKNG